METYVLCPEGGSLILIRLSERGNLAGATEEANFDSHVNAGDGWAGAVSAVRNGHTSPNVMMEEARAAIAAYDQDMDPDQVTVERVLDRA